MRNGVRSIMGLAALAVMLGGMLGQGETPVRAAVPLSAAKVAELRAIGEAVRAEAPPPTLAYASRTHSKISVNPDPLHPLGDVIEVSIKDQRLTAWRDGKIVYRFKISTARPGYRTPKGHFKILNKTKRWWSRQWQVWMPEALRFHGSYFIHGLPYRSDPAYRMGASRLGRADSHGCVRVGLGDSNKVWEWASVGTPVWVH